MQSSARRYTHTHTHVKYQAADTWFRYLSLLFFFRPLAQEFVELRAICGGGGQFCEHVE